MSNEQLCWTCSNACGKCSWSLNLTPVTGWTAEQIQYSSNERTYKVTECPLYNYDGECMSCSNYIDKTMPARFYYLLCKKHKITSNDCCDNYKGLINTI